MPMIPTNDERVRGYRAAEKVVKMLADSTTSERVSSVDDPQYKSGYQDGLNAALDLFKTYGNHPLENAHQIMIILTDEDAEQARRDHGQ